MMDTYFHQLDLNMFNDRIPGALPTPADRAKFLKPIVEKTEMSGHSIGIELARTIKSVLAAAGAGHRIKLLRQPYYGSHGEADRTQEDTTKSMVSEDDLKLGSRFGLGLNVLQVVTSLHNKACAFSMNVGESPQAAQGEPTKSKPSDMGNYTSPPVNLKLVNTDDDFATAIGDAAPRLDCHPPVNNTHEGRLGFDQLSESMVNVLTHQHRLFAYGLYVQWRWARILYFDRAGALVSEPFDWTETTSLLHDFVWKIAHMTPEQLGFDPTASIASESDIATLHSKMQDPSLPAEVQQYVRKAFLCTGATRPASTAETELFVDQFPIYRLAMPFFDSSSEGSNDAPFLPLNGPPLSGAKAVTERTFLVGRAHYADESLTGRCTRGYIAFDLQEEHFCFLKDSWRPLIAGQSHPEHWVYERLGQHNIPGIVTLICGGDVGGHEAQVTTVQAIMPSEKRLIPHVHYRIVVKEIGLPLTEFRSFTELSGIFRDAVRAHLSAWEGANILHRDVSVGNILIDPKTRRGMLVDWEMSILAKELKDSPADPNPSGTWRFRSALSLYYPRKPYRLSDDIESFIHAFQYMVLRFHRTDVQVLHAFAHSYFDLSVRIGGTRVGGEKKMYYFRSSDWPLLGVICNPTLQALLDEIASRCHHEFYKLVNVGLMATRYGLQGSAAGRSTQQRAPTDTFDAGDIDQGFLSHQCHLLELFGQFSGKFCGDKCEDQFVVRASEEPARVAPMHRGRASGQLDISQVWPWSNYQSRDDGTPDRVHVAIITKLSTPSAAASSRHLSPPDPMSFFTKPGSSTHSTPLVLPATAVSAPATCPPSTSATSAFASHSNAQVMRKRRQEDMQVVGGTVVDNEHNNGSEGLLSKPRLKRQRKSWRS